MFYFSYFLFSLIGLLSYFVSVYFLFLLIPVALLTYYWTRSKKLVIIGLIFAIIFLIIGWIFPKGIETKENITGIVIQRKETYYLILTTKGKYLVFDNSDMNLFSVVELSGYSSKLLFSHYEQGFNFKEYLNSQGVYYAYNVDQTKIIFKSLSISKPIQEWISKFLNTNSMEIVNSLLFGQGISSEKKELLNIYSLTSIFSLSGLHISFLIRIISNLTKARLKKKNDYVITTILFAFLLTSGFKFTIRSKVGHYTSEKIQELDNYYKINKKVYMPKKRYKYIGPIKNNIENMNIIISNNNIKENKITNGNNDNKMKGKETFQKIIVHKNNNSVDKMSKKYFNFYNKNKSQDNLLYAKKLSPGPIDDKHVKQYILRTNLNNTSTKKKLSKLFNNYL